MDRGPERGVNHGTLRYQNHCLLHHAGHLSDSAHRRPDLLRAKAQGGGYRLCLDCGRIGLFRAPDAHPVAHSHSPVRKCRTPELDAEASASLYPGACPDRGAFRVGRPLRRCGAAAKKSDLSPRPGRRPGPRWNRGDSAHRADLHQYPGFCCKAAASMLWLRRQPPPGQIPPS